MKFNAILQDFVEAQLAVGNVTALMGDAGIGKSSFALALAKRMSTKAFVLPCNQLGDKTDLTGARLLKIDDRYQQAFFPHEVIDEAIQYAEDNPRETPILVLDEINRTSSDVTSAILTVITLMRVGRRELPKNLKLVITGNIKGNVTALDEASISRFVIIEVEPDASTLVKVLNDAGTLHPYVEQAITAKPDTIFSRVEGQSIDTDGDEDDDNTTSIDDLLGSGEVMRQITTPRTIEGVSKWLQTLDDAKIQAYIGTPAPTEGRTDRTLFTEFLEAFVGNTPFRIELEHVITTAINAGLITAVTNSGVNVPRPNIITDLLAAKTRDEREDLIRSINDAQRSAVMTWLVSDRNDHTETIMAVGPHLNSLEITDLNLIISLSQSSALDVENFNALKNSGSPMLDVMGPVLNSIN